MITNFPNGVSSFGIPIIGAGPIMTTGRVLFADNAHPLASDSPNGGTKERPFRTIDYAIGQCAANAADHIIVGPAHVETLSGAGQLTLDVAGVSIIGVGNRGNRPTIALGTMRKVLRDGLTQDFATTLDAEAKGQFIAGGTADAMEGIMAFQQKRKTEFKGK